MGRKKTKTQRWLGCPIEKPGPREGPHVGGVQKKRKKKIAVYRKNTAKDTWVKKWGEGGARIPHGSIK